MSILSQRHQSSVVLETYVTDIIDKVKSKQMGRCEINIRYYRKGITALWVGNLRIKYYFKVTIDQYVGNVHKRYYPKRLSQDRFVDGKFTLQIL